MTLEPDHAIMQAQRQFGTVAVQGRGEHFTHLRVRLRQEFRPQHTKNPLALAIQRNGRKQPMFGPLTRVEMADQILAQFSRQAKWTEFGKLFQTICIQLDNGP